MLKVIGGRSAGTFPFATKVMAPVSDSGCPASPRSCTWTEYTPTGTAVVTPLPPDAPPSDFGPHEPGPGAAPAQPLTVSTEAAVRSGTLGNAELDRALVAQALDALERGTSRTVQIGDRALFIEAYPVKPRLVVVGAVQVAQPLVRIAHELGYETVVVDGRASFATPARFPDVDRLIVGWPDEIADEIGLGPSDAVARS